MIMSPYQLGNNYYLLLEGPGAPGNGTIYIYGPSGVTSFQETLRVEDVGTGVSVVFSPSSSAGYIQAGPLTIPIQVRSSTPPSTACSWPTGPPQATTL